MRISQQVLYLQVASVSNEACAVSRLCVDEVIEFPDEGGGKHIC